MTKTIFASLLFISLQTQAQNIGIGNTAPTNKLHITATTNPLRLEGLQSGGTSDSVVTVDASGVIRRRSLSLTSGGSGWLLTGNSGTLAGNSFIGTTDNISLSIRTNNQRSAYIEPDSTKRNNSFGNRALNIATTGNGNNAFGYLSLSKLTSGSNNIAVGDSAAFAITNGSNNVAIGSDALAQAVTATGNVAIGNAALKNSVTSENIAVGNNAAAGNLVGSNLVAIGANTLFNNQSASTQIAVGNNALLLVNSGQENIAIGYNTGSTLSIASYNVLMGHYALSNASNASNNTVIGHNAGLAYNASGNNNNTFIGYQSALSQTGGTGNSFVGAGIDLAGTFSISNSAALGQGVLLTASNQVRVGNTSVNSIGGQVSWTTFSDARIKNNIREDVHGLDFIMRLRPVTYNYDAAKLLQLQGAKVTDMNRPDPSVAAIRYSGLLAQEVEQAGKDVQYNFSGVDKPTNEHTLYGLRYAEFVVPLIKAVQEMKQLIDAQQKEIDRLSKLVKGENK
jgi:trimeric autotransporter adhesin